LGDIEWLRRLKEVTKKMKASKIAYRQTTSTLGKTHHDFFTKIINTSSQQTPNLEDKKNEVESGDI
jgi:hypothetical protein